MAVTNYQVFQYLASLIVHKTPLSLLEKARSLRLLVDPSYDSLCIYTGPSDSRYEFAKWRQGIGRSIMDASKRETPTELTLEEALEIVGKGEQAGRVRLLYENDGNTKEAIRKLMDEKELRAASDNLRTRDPNRGSRKEDALDRDDSYSRYKD